MATLSESAGAGASLEPSPPSSRLRWLFLVVSVLLLALLVASGVLAVRFLAEMRTQEMAATRALAERTRALSGLWLSVQSYDQAVQQFVAQTAADRDAEARRRLDQLTMEIDAGFDRYPSVRDAEEAALLSGLRGVFSQQRTLYITILTARPEQRRRQAESMLAERLGPVQREILDWSGKLQAWNGERLQSADRALVAQFANSQRSLSRALAIGFGSGLLLVLGSMAYIVRLDRQTRARYVELARSRHALQQLSARLVDAQETERRAISRELHDEVGQALGALLVDIGRLSTTFSGDHPEVKAQLDSLKSLAEGIFQSVRNMALLLRPSMLDDLGLAAALEWQGREVSRRSEIEVSVESESVPEDLPDEYKIYIYRLVQEALNNAVRHSGARNAKVVVERLAKSIVVRVTDDGRGFDPGRSRGMGILGMEERVNRLGGTLRVESQPGKGATVTAELPIPAGCET
ncbi:MAG: sensor histidine kinase [Bryobacteraceae bacterium]|jgi:signal transduction histidine kinase